MPQAEEPSTSRTTARSTRPTAGPPSLPGRPVQLRQRAGSHSLLGHRGVAVSGPVQGPTTAPDVLGARSVRSAGARPVTGDRGRHRSQATGSRGGSTGRRASSWWIVAPSGEEASRRRRIGSPEAARKTEGWGTSTRRERYDRLPDVGPARPGAAFLVAGACGGRKSARRSLMRAVLAGVQRHRESGATFRRHWCIHRDLHRPALHRRYTSSALTSTSTVAGTAGRRGSDHRMTAV